MSSVLRAHPRYALLSSFLILVTLSLLASTSTSPDSFNFHSSASKTTQNEPDWTAPSLVHRLEVAEELWKDSVLRRYAFL